MKRVLFIIIGSLAFILGTIGVFLPVLPTTPFYLLTGVLWLNSSPKLHAYFTQTSYYQKYIKEMILEKKMTKKEQSKLFIGLFLLLAIPFWLIEITLVRLLLVIVYLVHLVLLTRYFKSNKKELVISNK